MINRVVLVGRLTRDPELKYTTNGTASLQFSIAVNRTFTSANGEREADFINCVAWRNQAENMAKFVRKGSLLGVEGRIQTRSYQAQDGSKRYVTEVVAESVQFLEPRSSQNREGGAYGQSQEMGGFGGYGGAGASNNFPQSSNSFGGGSYVAPTSNVFPDPAGSFNNEPDFSSTINISDDDLPF
ncbi:MAG TPA: single-stranded DNA-binding protein [Firmicutes bacterium]|nr:single-stranded DNA-binding protein [Bacillota bacterium]